MPCSYVIHVHVHCRLVPRCSSVHAYKVNSSLVCGSLRLTLIMYHYIVHIHVCLTVSIDARYKGYVAAPTTVCYELYPHYVL